MLKHAFQPDGKMYFRLTRDGRPVSKVLSIYTEVFGSIALAELSRAAGDEQLWAKAMAMYDFLIPRFGQPSDTALLGYPIDAQFHLHAHDMCRITVAWVFNEIRPQTAVRGRPDAVGRVDRRQALEAGAACLAGKRGHGRLADARPARRADVPSRPRHRERLDADGDRPQAGQRRT